jgi:hypothetical protein
MNTNWNFMIKTSAIFLIILLFKKNCLVSAVDEEANANMSNDASNSQKVVDQQTGDGINVAKRAWKQLQAGWGKRDDISDGDYQMLRNYFHNLPVDDYNDRSNDYDTNYLTAAKLRLGNENVDEDSTENVEKRAWKQMNAAWGKRVNDWNKFRGKCQISFCLHSREFLFQAF